MVVVPDSGGGYKTVYLTCFPVHIAILYIRYVSSGMVLHEYQ